MSSDSRAEVQQAFVLAETALTAADQGLATAVTAQSAAVEAARLAQVAQEAAQAAFEFAERARRDNQQAGTSRNATTSPTTRARGAGDCSLRTAG